MQCMDTIVLEGVILKCLTGTKFAVEIDIEGVKREITGYVSGKMRKAYIMVKEGDHILIEISKADINMGRIIKRL